MSEETGNSNGFQSKSDDNGSVKDTKQGKPTNAFNSALEFWTKVDLPSVQKQLDEQGIEIKDGQKSSLLSRKNLATKTKEFKKLPDEEKLDQFKGLLKLYQNEIDGLTNKSKKIESYFFDFYRSMAEAPDPKPLLEISLDSVMETGEVANLKNEINKLNEELSRKADYQQLKQRLVRTEQKSAETLATKLKAKEDEFKALIDEKENNWSEKEKLVQKQLNDYKSTIEELKTSNEVTALQLSSHNKGVTDNNDNLTILAELEIVSRDAEFSKQRLLEVERRNEDLRRQLTISNNNLQVENIKEELNRKIAEMESENVLLIAELDQSRKLSTNLTKTNNKSIDTLNKDISQLKNEITSLKERLSKVKDYEEIKTELQFLRQIEFDGVEDNDEFEDTDDDINDKTKSKVDTLLIQRNKVLNNELIAYRSEHDSLVNRITELENTYEESTKELERVSKLNSKLEDDLSKFDNMNNFNDNMSMYSGVRKTSGTINSNGGEESSILPIITKQRDRFRDRTNELDNELKKQHNIVNELKRTINRLKQDNEELYERTRYLASSSKQRNQLQPRANIDLESNSYKSSYESKLHPIEQFRIQEQERISSRLSPFDRIYISITRAVLATRTTRMLFLFYCLALHFIVMLTTLYSTTMNTKMIPEVGINSGTGGIQAQNPI